MSRLRVFNEDDGGQVLLETREHTAIATELAEIGVRFEQWQACLLYTSDAADE